jgi:hypothetical protein
MYYYRYAFRERLDFQVRACKTYASAAGREGAGMVINLPKSVLRNPLSLARVGRGSERFLFLGLIKLTGRRGMRVRW